MGSPAPLIILPSISFDRLILIVSPKNLTPDCLSIPEVPSKICTTTISWDVSRTCPLFVVPSGRETCTSSPYETGSVFSTKTKGPDISFIVLYSFCIYAPSIIFENSFVISLSYLSSNSAIFSSNLDLPISSNIDKPRTFSNSTPLLIAFSAKSL